MTPLKTVIMAPLLHHYDYSLISEIDALVVLHAAASHRCLDFCFNDLQNKASSTDEVRPEDISQVVEGRQSRGTHGGTQDNGVQ